MKKPCIILLSATLIIVVAIWAISWLSWQPQSWYSPPDFSNPAVAKLADRAEYRLNEEFHKVRPVDAVWRVRITDEAMNAWLSGRLEGWLTHDQDIEFPPELHNPQVHVDTSGIWVAAMVEIDGSAPRPISMKLWVSIEESVATVKPVAIRLGKIPLPISVFEQFMQDMQKIVEDIEPLVPLTDDREVEIQAIELEDSSLILTCQTHLPQ